MKLFKKITWISVAAAMSIGGGIAALSSNTIVANAGSTQPIELTAEGGENASAAVFNIGAESFDGVKTGTSKKYGTVVVTVPANTVALHFHAAAWSGKTCKIKATGATFTNDEIEVSGDTGMSNNSPFTLSSEDETTYAYTLNMSGVTAETAITLTATGSQRFGIWKAVAEMDSSVDPTTLTGVTLGPKLSVVKVGAEASLSAQPVPSTATDVNYMFTSDATGVATVNTTSGKVTGVAAGVATISVAAYADGDEPEDGFTTSVKVAVTNHAGTEEDPFDVIDACNVATAAGEAGTNDTYYISGVVSNLTISSGKAKFDIISGEKTFQAYNLLDSNGNAQIQATDIHNGDTAVFLGKIMNYKGTTPETAQNTGRLVSVTSNTVLDSIEIRGTITKTVSVGEDFDISELDVYAIFSDDSETKVTASATLEVTPKTAENVGTTNITVNASYQGKNASANFDVTVEAALTQTKDEIVAEDFDATGTSYVPTTNKRISTNALYCALSAKSAAIQINSKGGYGIVSVRTGGRKITSVELELSTSKEVNVYGSNTPYTFAGETCAELYDDSTAGTLQGTLAATGTVTFEGSFRYVGIRAVNGAVKITKLTVNYEAYTAATLAEDFKAMAGDSWSNHVSTATCNSKYETAKELLLTLSTAELETFKTSTDTEIASARAAYENWCDRNGDDNPYAGAIVTSSRGVAINTSSSIAIVMIAIASITLVGAAMMLKKRKFSK